MSYTSQYLQYDNITGRIFGVITTDADSIDTGRANGSFYLAGEGHWDTHYVDLATLTIQPRNANPTTISGTTLSNVPVPSTIIVDNVRYEADEATVELSFTHAGTYEVTVDSVTALAVKFTVTV